MAILLGTIVGGLAATEGTPSLFLRHDHGVRGAVLGREPANPAHRSGRAQSLCRSQHRALDRVHCSRTYGVITDLGGALVTSWFWLVGAVALSLMPHAGERPCSARPRRSLPSTIAVFSNLAIGAVGVRDLSPLALAWRIALFPTLVGALLLAVFALDLGFATYGITQQPTAGAAQVFSTWRGIHVAIDLAGLAIAGRPVHRAGILGGAVLGRRRQHAHAWSRPFNVLNAAFIVGGTVSDRPRCKAAV